MRLTVFLATLATIAFAALARCRHLQETAPAKPAWSGSDYHVPQTWRDEQPIVMNF